MKAPKKKPKKPSAKFDLKKIPVGDKKSKEETSEKPKDPEQDKTLDKSEVKDTPSETKPPAKSRLKTWFTKPEKPAGPELKAVENAEKELKKESEEL